MEVTDIGEALLGEARLAAEAAYGLAQLLA
jgi:hypothetical protein